MIAEKDLIGLRSQQLDVAEAQAWITCDAAGGQVLFVGTVRRLTDPSNTGYAPVSHIGRESESNKIVETVALEYDAYPPLALKAMQELVQEIRTQENLERVVMLHRTGHLKIGEPAILIAASSQHRKAAFRAVESMIDLVKQRIPIWKKEILADGNQYWVHPKPDDSLADK